MARTSMIHHVNLPITDLQRSKEWYEEVFGVEDIGTKKPFDENMLTMCLGAGEFHLFKNPDPSRPASHPAIEVKDWDEMISHLTKLGIPFDQGRRAASEGAKGVRIDGSNYAYIRDPDGNRIEIVHHPDGLVFANTVRHHDA